MTDFSAYAIVCDYDGTLTCDDNCVHPENFPAIQEFVAAGGTFVLATGKSPREVDSRLLPLTSASVFCGGSIVYDPQARKILQAQTLPDDALDLVRTIYADYPTCGIHLACAEASYCLRFDPAIMPESFAHANFEFISVESVGQLAGKALVVSTHGPDVALHAIGRLVDERYPACTHTVSFPQFVDIMPHGVSKGSGLRYLRETSLADKVVLAAGDNINDFDLLSAADIGFAMGNADEELKAAADHVLSDCTHPCVQGMLDHLSKTIGKNVSHIARGTRRGADKTTDLSHSLSRHGLTTVSSR